MQIYENAARMKNSFQPPKDEYYSNFSLCHISLSLFLHHSLCLFLLLYNKKTKKKTHNKKNGGRK